MKKRITVLCIVIATLLCAFTLIACNRGDQNDTPPAPPVSDVCTVEIAPMRLTLDVGQTQTLSASVYVNGTYTPVEVEWGTSDGATVAVSSDGALTAKSLGTATVTATYLTYVGQCAVEVIDSGAKANLALGSYDITLKASKTMRMAPVVRYKGVSYTDATITYRVENEEIASVSSSGVIRALKYGQTDVTATAAWHSVTGDAASNLTKTFRINVLENIELTVTDESILLYNPTDKEWANENFASAADIRYTLTHNGEEVSDAAVVWQTDDNGVAVANNGKLIAVGVGETTLRGTYTYKGDDYTCAAVPVSVRYPVIDKADTVQLLVAHDTVLTPEQVFGEYAAITSIEADGVCVSDAQTPGKLNFEKLQYGTRTVTVYNADYGAQITVDLCTAIVNTFAELKALQYKGANVGIDSVYVLGNDIDCGGASFSGASVGWNANSGFRGELDGKGRKIYNFSVGAAGLFGTLGNAAIRNIRFEDVTQTMSYRSALLAATAYNSTVENVTVTYASLTEPAAPTECGVLIARQTRGCTFRNITVNAHKFIIPCLLGYEVSSNTYVEYNVYAKEVRLIGSDKQFAQTTASIEKPGGVTVHQP